MARVEPKMAAMRARETYDRRPQKYTRYINFLIDQIQELNLRLQEVGLDDQVVDADQLREKALASIERPPEESEPERKREIKPKQKPQRPKSPPKSRVREARAAESATGKTAGGKPQRARKERLPGNNTARRQRPVERQTTVEETEDPQITHTQNVEDQPRVGDEVAAIHEEEEEGIIQDVIADFAQFAISEHRGEAGQEVVDGDEQLPETLVNDGEQPEGAEAAAPGEHAAEGEGDEIEPTAGGQATGEAEAEPGTEDSPELTLGTEVVVGTQSADAADGDEPQATDAAVDSEVAAGEQQPEELVVEGG
jgi:hypothetical protein